MKSLSFKDKAINYRKRGYSYSMISDRLGLSKGTLSDWLREIPYKPNKEVLKRIQLAPAKSAEIVHSRKIANIVNIKQIAKKELGKMTQRDLWILGIGLYLGEGAKAYEHIRIINSDPKIIKMAIKWFRESCGIKNENFALTVHIYPDNNLIETLNYWSRITGIPKNQFRKTQIDRRTKKSKLRERKLPYGTVQLAVIARGKRELGVSLHRKIMGWIEATLDQI